MPDYPNAIDPEKVGTYPSLTKSGGGYVWDEVLEYRVWCHPESGAADLCEGDDYYNSFGAYAEAVSFSMEKPAVADSVWREALTLWQ